MITHQNEPDSREELGTLKAARGIITDRISSTGDERSMTEVEKADYDRGGLYRLQESWRTVLRCSIWLAFIVLTAFGVSMTGMFIYEVWKEETVSAVVKEALTYLFGIASAVAVQFWTKRNNNHLSHPPR